MQTYRTWDTQVEIYTASHWLNTNIYIYTLVGRNWKWMRFSPCDVDQNMHVLSRYMDINHTGTSHFDVVTYVRKTQLTVDTIKANIGSQNTASSKDEEKRLNDDARKQQKRQDSVYRIKENKSNAEWIKKLRKTVYSLKENARKRESNRKLRKTDYKEK